MLSLVGRITWHRTILSSCGHSTIRGTHRTGRRLKSGIPRTPPYFGPARPSPQEGATITRSYSRCVGCPAFVDSSDQVVSLRRCPDCWFLSWGRSCRQTLELGNVLSPKFGTQTLVPSNAMPLGLSSPPRKKKTWAPSLGRSFTNVSSNSIARQISSDLASDSCARKVFAPMKNGEAT